jgi:TRAP-type C4-dicarboxylate transport system permease small subunit
MLFTGAVGLSYGIRKARHIRMGAIFDAMNLRTKKVLIFFISSISALTLFMLSYESFIYVKKIFLKEHFTAALRLPYWIFVAIFPIGFFLAGVESILTIIKNISEADVWLSPEQQSEYE